MTNLEAVLALAEKLGIDTSSFEGTTTAEAIKFIADNYETEGGN
jgi:hypothetical protein